MWAPFRFRDGRIMHKQHKLGLFSLKQRKCAVNDKKNWGFIWEHYNALYIKGNSWFVSLTQRAQKDVFGAISQDPTRRAMGYRAALVTCSSIRCSMAQPLKADGQSQTRNKVFGIAPYRPWPAERPTNRKIEWSLVSQTVHAEYLHWYNTTDIRGHYHACTRTIEGR